MTQNTASQNQSREHACKKKMGSLGYVWHAQPESYDQLWWTLKENHVKKRRLRKSTTK